MGTLVFDADAIVVSGRNGPPWEFYRKGGRAYEADNACLPERFAMLFGFPQEAVRSSASQQRHLGNVDAMFGVSKRGVSLQWLPTTVVADGCRGWVLRRDTIQRDELGIRNPVRSTHYLAGAFLDDKTLERWAKPITSHPLGQALFVSWRHTVEICRNLIPWSVEMPEGTDPASFEDVEVLDALDNVGYVDDKRMAGIEYHVLWREKTFLVFVPVSEWWVVEEEGYMWCATRGEEKVYLMPTNDDVDRLFPFALRELPPMGS